MAENKIVEGLTTAVQMEKDGREYYLKCARAAANEAGVVLLERLAAEEDNHRRTFERIFQEIQEKNQWPSRIDFKPDAGKTLNTLFAEATKKLGKSAGGLQTELEAVQTALEMEARSRDFYIERSRAGASAAEKEFYDLVAAEELGHHSVLLSYFEYLKDPASWFVKAEHHSLDGG